LRIEQIVGQWIAKGRGDKTQAQLGEELGRYLGKPWSRQSVSAAEKGERAFTAAELIAFSLVLGCTVETLLEPPAGVEHVEIGDDGQIDSRHLRTTAATNSDLADLVTAVHELRQRWPQLQGKVDELDELFERAVREVWRAARGRGIDVAQEEADARNEARREKQARWRADLGLPRSEQ
jgi:hypothetical protein